MEVFGFLVTKNLSRSPDFRALYAAGYIVRTHPSQLYDMVLQKQVQDTFVSPARIAIPFNHPSYEALIYVPFSLLPFRAAYLAFIAFNTVLLTGVFFAARRVFSELIPFLQPRPGLMLLLFVPVMMAIWQGQNSIVFLLLCCLSWRQLNRNKDASAGLILALALFRFQLAVPVAILLAVRRGWRFSLGFVAGATAVISLSLALVGRSGIASLYALLAAGSMAGDQRAATQSALSIFPSSMANLRGLLYTCITRYLAPGPGFKLILLCSLALLAWSIYLVRRARREESAFAIAVLCAILVSYHLNFHDLSLLLLPIALLANIVPRPVVFAAYGLPAILFLLAGTSAYFLLAIVTLVLLAYAAQRTKPQLQDAVPIALAARQ